MSKTLVERLRAFPDNVLEGAGLCEEAAAELERLQDEVFAANATVADLSRQLRHYMPEPEGFIGAR